MATKKTDPTTEGRQSSSPASSASKGGAARKTATPGGSARKGASAAKGGDSAPKQPAASKSAGARETKTRGGPDLRADVRGFVAGRPQGWNHDEWLGFLEDLRARGHNVEDRDQIGAMLERERLGMAIEKVPGIGAQRVRSIADKYGNLWRLKEASPDELAREVNIPRPLAERIVESVR